MSFLLPRRRATEATAQQLAASGAGGTYLEDPDLAGFRSTSGGPREVPRWTVERAQSFSVASYRVNPMARAIVDTYTSFCVGDSGVQLQVTVDDVKPIAQRFWDDPRNRLGRQEQQELMLRDHMLLGESLYELMVGDDTGVVRWSPIDPMRLVDVDLDGGNPLWPATARIRRPGADPIPVDLARVDELTGLWGGQAMWWSSWKALLTDRRGMPFLSPILDWLDSYDRVLSNLIDRTALARYLVWSVQLEGADQPEIDEWVRQRGGLHAPRSGSMEVHNDSVTWTPKTAQTGAGEDTTTAKAVLTSVAGGAGLARTWLADPEDANRATSLTMAEPVRRRVGGVQNLWMDYQTELVQYAVDAAVRRGQLAPMATTVAGDAPVSQTVSVQGPPIAAANAEVTAEVLVRLSQSLDELKSQGFIDDTDARRAAKKAWAEYAGIAYDPALDAADGSRRDDVAGQVDRQQPAAASRNGASPAHAAL